MASANAEDNFLCSICLDIFNEPVSTPCGHNYCKPCITVYWATQDSSQCPLCKEEFQTTPDLHVNTEFRDMLELFKKRRYAADVRSSPPGPADVLCDLCHVTAKRSALKSCLVCLASYCSGHLKPHHSVQALKWHKLVNPVKTLGDRMCKKHNKVIEFFCKQDQSCVCVLCLKDHHEMHEAVSLEEELKERKTKLKSAKREVNSTLAERDHTIQGIQSSMMQSRAELERTKVETGKALDALVALIVSKKMMLMELLEGKQRAAEQQAETVVRQLQLEIVENNLRLAELEELSKSDDDFKLLKDLPSVSSSPNTRHPFSVRSLLQVETVRSAMAKMEEVLNEQMESITREIYHEEQRRTENPFDDELGIIQVQHAINLTLDPNTAHPSLILSEDGTQVRDGGERRNIPDIPTRFDPLHVVLGEEGFSSGKFYYEVQLEGQTTWEIGVVRESINRKCIDLPLTPENGCWTLGCYWGRCQANTNPPAVLTPSKVPERVGVFVDYEGGLVSFYDVDVRALIYTFTGCAFTAGRPFLRSVLTFRGYVGTPAKTKIRPLFRPSAEQESDTAALRIIPVRR
ncbi:E3 ubiquitin-protein ligase TRIM39-like [Notolabrus celidotus]|uniref:E3 ubiquitin-protein ligase TRIM39-like n=1 Tax=Notolabrus celidotus TaxID=1203425 RepID=UPI001490023A|nr:E3 ubiquitin-protein ligase TRIM39-like [Notolabrus celidotus]XP_034534848.1 E3 ubiquitin-protein ligase TRIM39-like [Notolabrus celidotus]